MVLILNDLDGCLAWKKSLKKVVQVVRLKKGKGEVPLFRLVFTFPQKLF